jgi:hypothetical protein
MLLLTASDYSQKSFSRVARCIKGYVVTLSLPYSRSLLLLVRGATAPDTAVMNLVAGFYMTPGAGCFVCCDVCVTYQTRSLSLLHCLHSTCAGGCSVKPLTPCNDTLNDFK